MMGLAGQTLRGNTMGGWPAAILRPSEGPGLPGDRNPGPPTARAS
jgi:hypothetical protein